MTRCKSKSYKLSTEFWLNYHLPQVLVSSPMCLILFWSPPRDPSSNPRRRSVPFGCLLTGVRHFTPAPQGPRGSKQQSPCYMHHVLKTITNTTIILWVDGKQNRDFSSFQKKSKCSTFTITNIFFITHILLAWILNW